MVLSSWSFFRCRSFFSLCVTFICLLFSFNLLLFLYSSRWLSYFSLDNFASKISWLEISIVSGLTLLIIKWSFIKRRDTTDIYSILSFKIALFKLRLLSTEAWLWEIANKIFKTLASSLYLSIWSWLKYKLSKRSLFFMNDAILSVFILQ